MSNGHRERILELYAIGGSVREIAYIVPRRHDEIKTIIRKATELPANFYEAKLIACARVWPNRRDEEYQPAFHPCDGKTFRRRVRREQREIGNKWDRVYREARGRGDDALTASKKATRASW